MRALRILLTLFASTMAVVSPAETPSANYVAIGDINIQTLLSDPPGNTSKYTQTELLELLALQASRSPEQIARCQAEVSLTFDTFSPIISSTFSFTNYPLTEALLNKVCDDTLTFSGLAKEHWDRLRPFELCTNIVPVIEPPESASYPSGHATLAYSWAGVLELLFPDKAAALEARAEEIGMDRMIAGVHFRSDVVAAKKLASAITGKLIQSAAFQSDLSAAQTELNQKHPPATLPSP